MIVHDSGVRGTQPMTDSQIHSILHLPADYTPEKYPVAAELYKLLKEAKTEK